MRVDSFRCKKCAGLGRSIWGGDCIYCGGSGEIVREIEIASSADRTAHMRRIGLIGNEAMRLKRRAAKARWKAKREEREASRQATSPAILAMDDPSRQVD
jgi:hypothetical protein